MGTSSILYERPIDFLSRLGTALKVELACELIGRLEFVTRKRPKVLLGVRPRQLGMDWQRYESHENELEDRPVHLLS